MSIKPHKALSGSVGTRLLSEPSGSMFTLTLGIRRWGEPSGFASAPGDVLEALGTENRLTWK
jgi:hypothetical protein